MAVVGDAYIVVRAISNRVRDDIQKELNGVGSLGEQAGRDLGRGLRRGINKSGGGRGLKVITPQLRQEAEEARLLFRTLARAQLFLVPAITGVLGAIGALGSGLLVLVGVLGNAARGSIVLVSALGGLAQAAVTVKLAFQGVGDAIKAGLKAQESSISNTRAEEAAARRLRDARLALKRLIEEEKPEALAAAREAAVRAEEAAADALLGSERATRTYNSAQDETLDALNDLNKARERATEQIQQLRFELEGGAISEKKARLEFEKARDSLQRVQDLPPNSRARQEAELAFAEAELNLRKAIDKNQDLKKAEEESTAAGVEGSQEVVDAKQRIVDAQQAETDAGISAAKAAKEVGRAQAAAAEAAAAASSGGSVERDINRRIAAAREQVQLAEQAAGDAAAGGINEFQKALDKLAPAQQQFVKFIISQQEAFEGLRAAAGRQLFPQLEAALVIIIATFDELEPLIEETGAILGRLAMDFAETFFQGENFERLKRVWADNNGLLEALGTTVINLAEGLLILLDNARPLVTAFGDWAVSTSEAWKNTQILKDENGELTTEFERLQDRIERITGIFGTYKEAFGTIFDVINQPGGAGDQLLTYFEEGSQSFLDFVKAGQEDGSLNEFFTSSTENFTKILDILKSIAGDLLNLGASEGLGLFLDGIQGAVDILGEVGESISGPDGALAGLGTFIEEFTRLFQLTTEDETFKGFFFAINNALIGINSVLQNETVQAIFKAVAPIFGFIIGFGLVQQTVRFVGKVIFGILLKAFTPLTGAFSAIGRILATMGTFGKVLLNVFGFLGRIFSFLIKFAGPIGFIISLLLIFIPIIIKNWDSIVAFFKGVFDRITAFVKPFIDGFVEFFVGAFTAIQEFLAPVIDFIVAYFTTAFDIIRAIIDVLVAVFQIAFVLIATAVQFVWDGIKAGFQAVSDFLKPILDKIFGFFGDIFGKVGDFVVGIWDSITEGFQAFLDFIEPGVSAIFGFFETVFNNVKGFFKDVMNGMIGFAEGFVNFFIDGLNGIIDKINSVSLPIPEIARGAFGGAETLGFNLRKVSRISLPRLAEGGIIKPTTGGVLSLIGEAGKSERVEPLDPTGLSQRDRAIIDRLSGGRGTTINVYPSAGMDERDLADLVSRRLAFELRRGAA